MSNSLTAPDERAALIELLLREGCEEKDGYGHPSAEKLADAVLAQRATHAQRLEDQEHTYQVVHQKIVADAEAIERENVQLKQRLEEARAAENEACARELEAMAACFKANGPLNTTARRWLTQGAVNLRARLSPPPPRSHQ